MDMYFDLYLPFPTPRESLDVSKKKKGKGKGQESGGNQGPVSCWDGLDDGARADFSQQLALSGHLGYSAAGCTVAESSSSPNVKSSPFRSTIPYPNLDPRFRQTSQPGSSTSPSSPTIIQVSRYHVRLDDIKSHAFTGANASMLKDYDLLSVQPMNDKAFQLACTELCLPGQNQISIITLPLHEKPYHFRLNRKQVRQAQRNGVMFELLYGPALFPSRNTSRETARRYRQNFLSNAREVVRLTGGKNVILSSGPGGSPEGLRGPLDIINLGTMLGLPSNFAKDAVSANPKKALLNAQARRTFKGVMTAPQMVPAPETGPHKAAKPDAAGVKGVKRPAEAGIATTRRVKAR